MKALLAPLAVYFFAAPALAAGPPAADMAAMPRCVWSQSTNPDKVLVKRATGDLNLGAMDVLLVHLAEKSGDEAKGCASVAGRDPAAAVKIMIIGFNEEALADQMAVELGLSREKLDAAIDAAPPEVTGPIRTLAEAAGPRRIDPARTPSMKPIFAALGQPTFDGSPKSRTAYLISTYVLNAFQLKVLAERYAAATP
jgi:hypothetical protein